MENQSLLKLRRTSRYLIVLVIFCVFNVMAMKKDKKFQSSLKLRRTRKRAIGYHNLERIMEIAKEAEIEADRELCPDPRSPFDGAQDMLLPEGIKDLRTEENVPVGQKSVFAKATPDKKEVEPTKKRSFFAILYSYFSPRRKEFECSSPSSLFRTGLKKEEKKKEVEAVAGVLAKPKAEKKTKVIESLRMEERQKKVRHERVSSDFVNYNSFDFDKFIAGMYKGEKKHMEVIQKYNIHIEGPMKADAVTKNPDKEGNK